MLAIAFRVTVPSETMHSLHYFVTILPLISSLALSHALNVKSPKPLSDVGPAQSLSVEESTVAELVRGEAEKRMKGFCAICEEIVDSPEQSYDAEQTRRMEPMEHGEKIISVSEVLGPVVSVSNITVSALALIVLFSLIDDFCCKLMKR